MSRIEWRTNEDRIMREIYPRVGYKGVKKLIPYRSRDSIQQYARRIGVSYKWTKEMDLIVLNIYPSLGSKGVQYFFPDRSRRAINMRAQYLHCRHYQKHVYVL